MAPSAAAAEWDAAARATLERRNAATRRAAEHVGTECMRLEWDSEGARAEDLGQLRFRTILGSLLWLGVVAGVAGAHISSLAPLLHRPYTHAAVAVACGLVGALCGVGAAGWLSAVVRWPAAEGVVGGGCAGGGGGCLHAYALLAPLAVVPIALEAAFVLADALEASWRERHADVAEERFAHAARTATPRLFSAATAAAAAPACGALASRLGAPVAAAPFVQLAAAVGIGALAAHVLVLSVFWGGILLELRGEVRVLLRATSEPPELAYSKAVHAALRREAQPALALAAALAVSMLLALRGASHLPVSVDVRRDLPSSGRSIRFHEAAARTDAGAAAAGWRSVRAEVTSVDGQPIRMGDPRHCRALMAASRALQSSGHVVALASWLDAFATAEGTADCEHLAQRAREGALAQLLLRRPELAGDVLLSSSGAPREPILVASRWWATLQLPTHADGAIDAIAHLQAALRDAAETPPGSSHASTHAATPILALGGAPIAELELARRAPSACVGWFASAAVGSTALLLTQMDPVAVSMMLASSVGLAVVMLGLLSLLSPPMGSGQLVWVVLASATTAHAPALALQSIVTHFDGSPGGGSGGGGGGAVAISELTALARIAPPLLRSCATALFTLLPLPLVGPSAYLRTLGLYLLAALILSTFVAIVLVPLLHVVMRRPPPPPPPPPPASRRGGGIQGRRLLPFGSGGARIPSYGSAGGAGSCLASWQEERTLPQV